MHISFNSLLGIVCIFIHVNILCCEKIRNTEPKSFNYQINSNFSIHSEVQISDVGSFVNLSLVNQSKIIDYQVIHSTLLINNVFIKKSTDNSIMCIIIKNNFEQEIIEYYLIIIDEFKSIKNQLLQRKTKSKLFHDLIYSKPFIDYRNNQLYLRNLAPTCYNQNLTFTAGDTIELPFNHNELGYHHIKFTKIGNLSIKSIVYGWTFGDLELDHSYDYYY